MEFEIELKVKRGGMLALGFAAGLGAGYLLWARGAIPGERVRRASEEALGRGREARTRLRARAVPVGLAGEGSRGEPRG